MSHILLIFTVLSLWLSHLSPIAAVKEYAVAHMFIKLLMTKVQAVFLHRYLLAASSNTSWL